MRERHNIVGSEVGHARLPIYFRAALPHRPRRRGGRRLLAALLLTLALAGAALAWLEQGVAEGLQPAEIWPAQEGPVEEASPARARN